MKYLGLFTTTYLDFRLGRDDYHGLALAYNSIFFLRTGINLRLGIGDFRLISFFSSSVPSAPLR